MVEDDPDGQEVLATFLEQHGIAVDVAADAEQAESRLFGEGALYDAVIIDLALPGKDGWQLLSEIRSAPDLQNVVCYAVTAYHTSKTREDALNAGFDGYFAKPVDAQALLRQLDSSL